MSVYRRGMWGAGTTAFIAVALACVFSPCTRADDEPETNDLDTAYEYMELFSQTMLHIRKHYVEEKSYKDIVYGALEGMLSSLDPHSAFLDPDAYADIRSSTTGKFGGIGIRVGIRDGGLTIIAPIEDTPGFKAGLQSGDRILAIDGEKTRSMSLQDAIKRMRGEPGTKVVLTIVGENTDGAEDVGIIRADIRTPSVKGARMLRDGIGYVRITQFSAPTASLLQTKLEELQEKKMQALVLDLRGNPGGLLSAAVEVAQLFLKPRALIVTRKGRPGVYDPASSYSHGDQHYTQFPMVVLVNGGSASASEIVSGALQDHRRAVLVGTTTFGKASVQSVIKLESEEQCAIRLTTAYYYTPSGRLIHEKGIEPDIPVYIPGAEWRDVLIRRAHVENPELYDEEVKAEYQDVVDRQLVRAVDLLQAIDIFETHGGE